MSVEVASKRFKEVTVFNRIRGNKLRRYWKGRKQFGWLVYCDPTAWS
jgi:hypothetical protein